MQTLSKRNLWSFSVGTIGRDMAAAGLFTNYLLTYVLFTKTLSATQFTVITIIMFGARFFDAVIDPLLGNLIDTSTSKNKFKPFIFWGAIGTAVIVSASFANRFQGWSYVVFFGVMYLLFSVCFSVNDIAYWGMLPSLTTNQNDRNRLTSMTTLMAGVGAFLCSFLVPVLTVGDRVIGGSAVTGYAVIGIVFSIIMLGTQLITLLGVKEERKSIPKPEKTKFSIKETARVILQNPQAKWSGVILFIYMMVSTLSTTMIATYLYFSFGYNGLYLMLFNIVGQVSGAVVFIIFPLLSRKLGRNRLVRLAVLLSITGYTLLFLSGTFLNSSLEMVKLAVMAAFNILPSIGNGVFYLVVMINIANAVEYNEWAFGKRNEGIIFSVRPFVTQLGMGLGQLLTMAIYLLVGILSATNKISLIENEAAQATISGAEKTQAIQQIILTTPNQKSTLLLLFITAVPLIGIYICYRLYKSKQLLSETEFESLNAELVERRKQDEMVA
ncbi:MFS transporter [Enterococcus dispar]|uniref:MFS transporter n=1 Tax=Enterococcus dispar TaxID=44009 RepID=UPI00232AB40D|nr:MFS transporter [Enterococcus dispar]WCG33877.1 MFS transporter [Enterococcus dispar]